MRCYSLYLDLKASNTFFFKSFSGLPNEGAQQKLKEIEQSIAKGDFDSAIHESKEFMELCIEALNYYQT